MPESWDDEVMTLREVAAYLKLAERTVLRMAQRGEIPAAKIASQWRFLRAVVRDWVAAQMQSLPAPAPGAPGGPHFQLDELLRPELMRFNVQAGPKEAVLRQLVAPLAEAGVAREPGRLLAGLLERERMLTTAIGHGVALPHPRQVLPGMFTEPALVLGVCPDGTDFAAVDDRRVHVFLLICATREPVHLAMMARVAWFLRCEGVLEGLAAARASADVAALVRRVGGSRPR